MKTEKRAPSRVLMFVVGFLTLIGLGVLMSGQEALRQSTGMPEDWTHHHLVFSNPGSAPEALARGRVEHWYRIITDFRFNLQQFKRNAAAGAPNVGGRAPARERRGTLHRDWSMPMGSTATVGAGMYPAKYSFSTTTANCASPGPPDFVVYNTGVAGSPPTAATGTVTIRSNPSGWGDTRTVTIGATTYTFVSSLTAVNQVLRYTRSSATYNENRTAQNLRAVIDANSSQCYSSGCVYSGQTANASVTATVSSNVVTLTATTTGSGSDFTLSTNYSTGIAVSGGNNGTDGETIIAYDNLYSGCSGNVPTTYWQYNTAYPQGSTTGDGSKITTSPVLSLDGTQVAFVQSNSSNVASLVLLKWASNSSPVQMNTDSNNVTAAYYRSCTAPCMTRITFSGLPNDTNSSPFYNYPNDTLYVGDASGSLHKFTGVFGGTPAKASTPWPISVHCGTVLSSPVFDSGSGNIFVGDGGGTLWYVRETTSNTGACSSGSPPCVGSTSLALGGSIVDGPLVDSTNETVFVSDGTTRDGTHCSTYGVVAQTNTALGAPGGASSPVVVCVGGTGTGSNMYAGNFDNTYFIGAKGSGAGHLYVCGKNSSYSNRARLYPLTFTTSGGVSVLSTTVPTGVALASANTETCSPITEFNNTSASTDWIFVSVSANGSQTGCTGACIYAFNVNSVPTSASAAWPATGGTSGIIVDNTVGSGTLAGASQVYFGTLSSGTCSGATSPSGSGSGTGGCAVQASQSAP